MTDFEKALDGITEILILPHNDPDPDAIAASLGLAYLLKERYGIAARLKYHGIIGRAENKALVHYLRNPLKKITSTDQLGNLPVALVDTQPGTGNNPLPESITPYFVFDHHFWREKTQETLYHDVRPNVGASATLITEYIQKSGLSIPTPLATALFYGIKTDTMGLARGVSAADLNAYCFLQPKIDIEALLTIERAQVPAVYFESLVSAIQRAQIHDDDLITSYIGKMRYPDLGAEVADLLLRLEKAKWVICVGYFQKDLILSIRSRSRLVGAGNLAQHIVGSLGTSGGHGTMAGGHIPLRGQEPASLSESIVQHAVTYLKGDEDFIPRKILKDQG